MVPIVDGQNWALTKADSLVTQPHNARIQKGFKATMELKKLLRTWEGTQAENKWNRLIIAALIIVLFIVAIKAFTKETVVIMQPPTLAEEGWLESNKSSQSYQEAWGVFMATLVGNVTPASVVFLKERIGPLLSPAIYSDVMSALESQANQIRNDRISLRFEMNQVHYEAETGKVFVYGNSYSKGVSGLEDRKERTYEYIVRINRYQPVFEYMATYEGRPRSQKILQQMERREQVRSEREKKNEN